jgi:regulator of replication initiation timing
MRTVFSEVESQIEKEFGDGQHGVALSAQQRVARMVAENKRRLQLRSEALKRVLQPDQYSAYLQEESQSAASDVEVFHDSGSGDTTDAK